MLIRIWLVKLSCLTDEREMLMEIGQKETTTISKVPSSTAAECSARLACGWRRVLQDY